MTGIETVFAILLSGLHWGFASTILWNCLCEIILFTDKLNPSTDNFPFYYINVKFFKKSVKTCDGSKPFPKSCDKTHSPPDIESDGVFSPTNRDKSAVWALLGEVGYLPDFLFRATWGETGRVRFSRCSSLRPSA